MKCGKRGSGGYVPPTREDRGSGVKKEESEGRIEEIVQKQSKEAQEFYEELWKKEEEKEQRKKDYWRDFDKKMKATMPVKKIEIQDEEVEDLRRELVKVCKKYRKLVIKLLEKARGNEVKGLKELLEDDEALRRYIKNGNIRAEIAIGFVIKVLLKLTTKDLPRKALRELEKDLERVYMTAKKLAVRTDEFNNVLAIFEGLALKAISARKHQKIIQRMYFKNMGVTRVIYPNGRTYTKMYPLKRYCFKKIMKEEIKPRIPVSLVMDITGISVSNRGVRGNITTIGAKDHFDYPFRSDFIGHMDTQGKRIVKIELNRFLSADESLTSFEYGDV